MSQEWSSIGMPCMGFTPYIWFAGSLCDKSVFYCPPALSLFRQYGPVFFTSFVLPWRERNSLQQRPLYGLSSSPTDQPTNGIRRGLLAACQSIRLVGSALIAVLVWVWEASTHWPMLFINESILVLVVGRVVSSLPYCSYSSMFYVT